MLWMQKSTRVFLLIVFFPLFVGTNVFAQGGWKVYYQYFPATFRKKVRHYHDGGWEKLFMLVGSSSAFSQSSVFDSAFFGSGGSLGASADRGDNISWDFIPVVETIDDGGRRGIGYARFQGGHLDQSGYAGAPDGPSKAKFALFQKAFWKIGNQKGNGGGGIGVAVASEKSLIGELSFSFFGFTLKIGVVSYSGMKRSASRKEALAPSALIPAGFASLEEKTSHLVDISADASFGSAYSYEFASGDLCSGMELTSRWAK